MLNQDQFNDYARDGYNRIPLVREVLADLETPLSTYLKVAGEPYTYLLESVQGGEKWGRYSIIGLPCQDGIKVKGNVVSLIEQNQAVQETQVDDPLESIRQYQARFKVPTIDGLPRFTGGLVGYFGYDTIQYVEGHLASNVTPDPIDAPDVLLMLSEEVIVFDNLSGRLFIIVHANPETDDAWDKGRARLDELISILNQPLPIRPLTTQADNIQESDLVSSFPQAQFKEAVEACRNYIFDGDAFQIVLSQRLSIPYKGDPLDLYRSLRTLNPSPYMYFFDMGDFQIAGSSPEILVRLEEGEVTVRPIAGTRKRGGNDEEDQRLEEDLLADPKELAEHLMLIDLGRNDVGRIAETGTVNVTDKMAIEKYSHVMHIVSNVTGKIKPDLDAIDVLKATFPAGTLSGAPKVRAMEIIEDLEPDKRGIYSGAIGYIGWNGNMDTAIAIRTALIKDDTVYVQAGAGIVADSVPQMEWEETMNKGRAVFHAVSMAKAGLHNPLDQEG